MRYGVLEGVPAARSGGVCGRNEGAEWIRWWECRRGTKMLSRETSAVERIGGLRATYYTLSRN